MPARVFLVVSFFLSSLWIYHDIPFWPTKLLLKIHLIALWGFLCMLLMAFLLLLLRFPLSLIFAILLFFFLIFFFWPCHAACWFSVSQPGMEPRPQQWKPGILTLCHQGTPFAILIIMCLCVDLVGSPRLELSVLPGLECLFLSPR